MSSGRRDSRPPRGDARPAGDDPWARWREPAAAEPPPADTTPAPEVEGRDAEPEAAAGEERTPLGTLSVRRRSAPADKRSAKAGPGKPSSGGARATDGRRPEGKRPSAPPVRGERDGARKGQPPGKAAPAARRVPPAAGDDPWATRRRPEAAGKKPALTTSTVNEAPAAAAASHEARPAPTGVRLSKVMSERGLCSRREADLWIERGWVFVNGEQISELGSRIDPGAQIEISPEASKEQAKAVTILLHKPVGYVSGQPEPGMQPAVTLITPDNQQPNSGGPEFKPWMLRGLAPAGRLDVDSTGLLVLTSDGRVAKRLIGENSDAEKEYLVRVSGQMISGGLELLRHGLELDGKPLKPAWVKQLNEDQLHFILKEGRKRQIRRMCELVGLRVIGLKRVRIGRIRLGDLPLGQWRFLRDGEAF